MTGCDAITGKDKPLDLMSCSGGCGRLVEQPAILKNVNVKGGKIRVLCKKCSRSNSYYQKHIKDKS